MLVDSSDGVVGAVVVGAVDVELRRGRVQQQDDVRAGLVAGPFDRGHDAVEGLSAERRSGAKPRSSPTLVFSPAAARSSFRVWNTSEPIRTASPKLLAPTGAIMNSWKSRGLSACAPPLTMLIIGSGSTRAAAPLILRESGSATRSVLHDRLTTLPDPLILVPAMELTSATAIENAAASGLGPAVLSELTVRDEIADRTLVEVPVTALTLRRDLHACWRRGHRFSAPARHLLDIATTSGQNAPART